MKKILSLLLTFTMVLSLVAAIGVMAIEEGEGPSTTTPEAVSTPAEFAAMVASGNYYLADDITIDATYLGTFIGTLDGKGHTVTVNGVPMFSEINATVSNLTIKGNITTTEIQYVGALSGKVSGGTYTNITNEAVIKNTMVTESDYACAGGLFGYLTKDNTVTVNECANKADLHSVECVGGMIADTAKGAKAVFTKCTNTGKITSETNSAGGIFGLCKSDGTDRSVLTFTDCENTGAISSGKDSAGGICAYGQGYAAMTFTNCKNSGTVSSSAGKYASGGILGDGDGVMMFENCVNTGDVTHATYIAGGIVAEVTDNCTFINCVNAGNITSGTNRAAGIVADVKNVELNNCLNTGEINGATAAAGICSAARSATMVFEYCGNTGKVTSGTDTAAGINSYAAGGNTPIFRYCFNTGDISGSEIVAAIAGYFNHSDAEFTGCYNIGKLTCLNADYKSCAIYYSNNATHIPDNRVSGVFYLAECAEFEHRYKSEDTATSYIALDTAKTVSAEDVASGKLCYMLNEAAGKTVYYQTIGTDAFPVLDNTSKEVIKDGDTYKNPETGVTLPEFDVVVDMTKFTPDSTSYTEKTGDGWTATNAAIKKDSVMNDNSAMIVLNGKTLAAGTLTSSVINGGLKTLGFNYGLPFSDTNIGLTVNVKKASDGTVIKTEDIVNSSAVTNEVYTFVLDVDTTENVIIEIVNNSPSAANKNKDRTGIWNLGWVENEAPETSTEAPETSTEAPETSTEAPETSTEAPETSTEAPETSTEVPETSTEAPETSTNAPETTTKSPETTKAPETTAPSNPETGDSTVAILFALAAACAGAILVIKKKEN